MNEQKHIVGVAVWAPPYRIYSYLWPARFGKPSVGIRVRVPFGRTHRIGVVARLQQEPLEGVELKWVADRLDADPWMDEARIDWLARLARYYLASPGEIWQTALGWARALEARCWRAKDAPLLAQHDAMLAKAFPDARARRADATWRLGIEDGIWRVARAARHGWLAPEPVPFPPVMPASEAPPEPSQEQRTAIERIVQTKGFRIFVLYGPTGSGKTEVYLQAAQALAAQGRQTLALLPEIALTPQWLARASARLKKVAPWHSGLAAGERVAVAQALDAIEMLVGARSAVFMPLPRLGLIVIDEEHDTSFKSQQGVPVSAREAAILLAQQLDVPIVLGSATPSAESWRLVEEGKAQALTLSQRITPAPEPEVRVVDLRRTKGAITSELAQALKQTIEEGGQAMLYLNRRGYARALQCMACGEMLACPHCSVHLVLHRKNRAMRCHLCGYSEPAPSVCPACGEAALAPLGTGSERLEDTLRELLPKARIARLDRDAVSTHNKLLKVLERFRKHEIDVLVGTQMLIQGHHFPHVTLVGVINADLGIGLPDPRAAERWRQRLAQIIGRAGRGSLPGRVIVQTRMPDAPWLKDALQRPYLELLKEELALRKELRLPPYARCVRVLFEARDERLAAEHAARFAHQARGLPAPVEITGPSPCAIERIEGRWRYEVVLRDPSRRQLPWRLAPLFRDGMPAQLRRRVDVDPVDWM